MSASHQNSRKSIHQLAFQHYLRTGQRLTNGEWSALHERKFNPYHDERGRFTSPPGAIISWGKYGGPRDTLPSVPRGQLQDRENTSPSLRIKDDLSEAQAANISGGGGDPLVPTQEPSHGGFRSDFVRNAVPSQTGHAETYFELNRRQAYLDQLRREAGKNANALVKADLDDFQRRLDSDRIRLDEINRRIIDKYTSEILRAGVVTIDVGIGAPNIVSADGETIWR